MTRDDPLSVLESSRSLTILVYIAEHEGCGKMDLYRDTVRNSSMPRKLDALEDAGLITQTPDDRATVLRLTDKGRYVAENLMRIRDAMSARGFRIPPGRP